MKTIRFYISAFLYAYNNDHNFRELLSSLYKVFIFIAFGISSLIFLAWILLTLGGVYKN